MPGQRLYSDSAAKRERLTLLAVGGTSCSFWTAQRHRTEVTPDRLASGLICLVSTLASEPQKEGVGLH
jgi:hypothetical protein